MANTKTVVALIVALTIAATLFAPIANVVDGSTGTVDVADESVTAAVGEPVSLEGYNVDSSTVVVENSDGSTVNSSDYSVNERPGELELDSGGSVDEGDALSVSYAYEATSGTTTTLVGMVPLFLALLILGVLASKVADMA